MHVSQPRDCKKENESTQLTLPRNTRRQRVVEQPLLDSRAITEAVTHLTGLPFYFLEIGKHCSLSKAFLLT